MGPRGVQLSKARNLYELQEIDLKIDSRRKMLADVSSRIGESEALNQARSHIIAEEQQLAEVQRKQRELEAEVEDLKAKVSTAEGKLYGGTLKNPKELSGLQEQSKNYHKKISEQEDKILDIMAEIETVGQQISAKRKEADRIEAEWQAEQASLLQEQAKINIELSELEDKKKECNSKIDAASLELYRLLREKRQGRAVAKVERGLCQGCGISLPVNEMQRVKQSQKVVQCGSCERILYLS
jgi:predicted  nucleic acid-binding Zn-ribbon protein